MIPKIIPALPLPFIVFVESFEQMPSTMAIIAKIVPTGTVTIQQQLHGIVATAIMPHTRDAVPNSFDKRSFLYCLVE